MTNSNITKETFMEADEHTQMGIIFDLVSGLYERLDRQLERCDSRFGCLEKNKTKATVYATIGGFAGGITAFFSQWFLRR